MLRSMPQDVPVFVEGYETGLDAIHSLRLVQVTGHLYANEWDGEYREVQGKGFSGTPATILLGRRGHRRPSGIGSPHPHGSPPIENALSTGVSQMDALLEAKVFAAQRGCPPESLPQACAAHRIFAVVIDGIPLYPAFYVDPP